MIPASIVPVLLTAAELRALAGVHDTFADAADNCALHIQAEDSRTRAALLRRLADQLGPPSDSGDGLLGVSP